MEFPQMLGLLNQTANMGWHLIFIIVTTNALELENAGGTLGQRLFQIDPALCLTVRRNRGEDVHEEVASSGDLSSIEPRV